MVRSGPGPDQGRREWADRRPCSSVPSVTGQLFERAAGGGLQGGGGVVELGWGGAGSVTPGRQLGRRTPVSRPPNRVEQRTEDGIVVAVPLAPPAATDDVRSRDDHLTGN